MDILEKARAYDEALEKAKKELQACGSTDCDSARQIFRLFPELVESEDEKIRKEILGLVQYTKGRRIGYEPRIHQDEMIAWLEKQKDINSKEYVFRPLAGCDINTAAIQAIEQQKLGNKVVLAFNGAYIPVEGKTADDIVNEYYSWVEKQNEQKPIDYNKELKKCRENPLYFFDKYVKIKVQKPAWSEEDEEKIEQICEDLESALENFTKRKNVRGLHFEDIIKSNIEWLKSLKDRLKGE